VQTAKKLKNKLSVAELLKQVDIQTVLRDCMTSILAPELAAAETKAIVNTINQHITIARNSGVPDKQGHAQRIAALSRTDAQRFELTLKRAMKKEPGASIGAISP
jgi:hypothetical protein